jgi:uncharacterized protein (DUF488 family)
MVEIPIYTIGYGNRSREEFVELLQRYEIEFLIDVRSQPYSRYTPQFSKDALETFLQDHHIRYVFMGDALGGRPKDEACYINGKVAYEKVAEQAFYQQGIERLCTAWTKQLHVALMCAEVRPQECHRSKLIGNTLAAQHIEVAHIDESGAIKGQQDIDHILMGNQPVDQLSLFDQAFTPINKKTGYSRKKIRSSREGDQ